MLEAASSSEEDQLQWEGLVESKIRHLISQLERENISLAHVWPKPYSGREEDNKKTTCYWFVGLVVGGSAGAHLDLTLPIKTFTDIVMRSAIQINVWKTGMRIEANYKKRKESVNIKILFIKYNTNVCYVIMLYLFLYLIGTYPYKYFIKNMHFFLEYCLLTITYL